MNNLSEDEILFMKKELKPYLEDNDISSTLYALYYDCNECSLDAKEKIKITDLLLEKGVFEIDEGIFLSPYVFDDCKELPKRFELNPIQIIPEYCFNNCLNLEELIIGDDCHMVGDGAFAGCKSLRKIVFKGRINFFHENAFSHNNNYGKINIEVIDTISKSNIEEALIKCINFKLNIVVTVI